MGFDNIILNIPHSLTRGFSAGEWDNPGEITRHMREWTDWHTEKLFKPEQIHGHIHTRLFPFSRFFVDVERLVNDPMKAKGQGIVYNRFGEACRQLPAGEEARRMEIYHKCLNGVKPLIAYNTIIVDCHSFPSRLAPDVDFCIGFNEDESKPDDCTINGIIRIIRRHGYRVAVNAPYSNAITPVKPITYKSVMIEVNKQTYMDENTLGATINARHVTLVLNLIIHRLAVGHNL